MAFFLERAAGQVLLPTSGGGLVPGGTCFAFRQRHHVVTAGHCVPTDGPSPLVAFPEGVPRQAIRIDRHDTADVALITTEPEQQKGTASQVVLDIAQDIVSGGDFLAYGYPAEPAPSDTPVARLMKGHFQRYVTYRDPHDRSYFAGEMSIPAPAGASGGPVVRASQPQLLEGVITANVDSYVVLDQVEEVLEDGKGLRVESKRVVSYGIAAMAVNLRSWLADLGVYGALPQRGSGC